MIDDRYETFMDLHKEHLKEIFYPIKTYLNSLGHTKNNLYLFFPKHDILLNYESNEGKLTNFGGKFLFVIKHKNIKKVKLFYENKNFREFWTCGSEFTKFYFKNYLNNRICIKSEGNFQSIDLDNEADLNKDKYYVLSERKFDYKKVIEPLLHLNYDNPPEELSYIIKKGNYFKEYELQEIHFENENWKTFFHNEKIGITLSIIKNFFVFYHNKWRIFYFDINYIYYSSYKTKKKYFMYFLNLLFLKDEVEKANAFMTKIYSCFKKYNEKFDILLEDIIQYFNKDRKILLIFDNIHSKSQYDIINKMTDKINLTKDNHIFIREFIEINGNTLDIIKQFFEDKKSVKTVGNFENMKYDLKIIIKLKENNQDYLSNYKIGIDDNLSKLFEQYSITKHTNLIKLFYYLNRDNITKDESEDLIVSNLLKDFISFLYIKISDCLVEIKFRNKIIENSFKNFYIFYYNIFLNEQSKLFLTKLLESEKGYNFERQIIFSIIIGSLTKNYERINIERIYCVKKFPKIKLDINNINILFYQNISNAPLYDFGVLLQFKGKLILKVFQVFTNKDIDEINKLKKNKIIYDLCYFIEKICRILNKKIEGFTFGIIISKTLYNKYKDKNKIKLIKEFCLYNKYEFLLYDLDKNKFSKDINQNEINCDFQEIKSFEELESDYYEPFKIFKDGCKIYKKFYIEKIKVSSYIKKFDLIFKYFEGEIKLELVGKFDCDISVFEQNAKDNIFYYYSWNDNKNFCIYYKNYKIYEKLSPCNISLNEGKKEVLIFMNKNSDSLKKNDCFKFNIEKLVLKEENKEKDINYLIFENANNYQYILPEEENDDDSLEENNDELKITKDALKDSQNFQNDDKEYEFKKDINGYKYLIVYNKNKHNIEDNKNSIDNPKIEEEDFKNFEEADEIKIIEEEEKVNFDDKYLKPYKISEKIFYELVNGNYNEYQKLKKKIDKDMNKNDKNGDKLLEKKRYNSFPNKSKKN